MLLWEQLLTSKPRFSCRTVLFQIKQPKTSVISNNSVYFICIYMCVYRFSFLLGTYTLWMTINFNRVVYAVPEFDFVGGRCTYPSSFDPQPWEIHGENDEKLMRLRICSCSWCISVTKKAVLHPSKNVFCILCTQWQSTQTLIWMHFVCAMWQNCQL